MRSAMTVFAEPIVLTNCVRTQGSGRFNARVAHSAHWEFNQTSELFVYA